MHLRVPPCFFSRINAQEDDNDHFNDDGGGVVKKSQNERNDNVKETTTTTAIHQQQQVKQELPANLRRKVRAKRPTLGHVVPKWARNNRSIRTKMKQSGGSAMAPTLQSQGTKVDEEQLVEQLYNPSRLRITAGSARGKRLDSPNVYLRPMMGKVREAVFSTLTSFGLYDDKFGARHLDIFAGSGSVGLESLSRGAAHCTFVDFSRDCCNAVQRNLQWCQFVDNDNDDDDNKDDDDNRKRTTTAQVVCADYLVALRDPESVGIPTTTNVPPFDIVTLTPPYEEVLYSELLEAVVNSPLFVGRQDTIVVIEYPTELGPLPHVVSGTTTNGSGRSAAAAVTMVGIRNRRYGRTVIAMYVMNPSGNLPAADSRPEEFVSL